MRFVLVMVVLLATACGKGGQGWECNVDADCNRGLLCGLLKTDSGAPRTMCVDPDGVLDPAATPKSYRGYALPAVAGGAVLVLLLVLRSSLRARRKRKR